MKIKNLALIALIIAIHARPHQIHKSNNDRAVSISKSTILVLLAVGFAGALSVRRKKKTKIPPVPQDKSQSASDDRDKAFIQLNKRYLNLQYKMTRHRFCGDRPPDCLIKELSDLERKVRLIDRALE